LPSDLYIQYPLPEDKIISLKVAFSCTIPAVSYPKSRVQLPSMSSIGTHHIHKIYKYIMMFLIKNYTIQRMTAKKLNAWSVVVLCTAESREIPDMYVCSFSPSKQTIHYKCTTFCNQLSDRNGLALQKGAHICW